MRTVLSGILYFVFLIPHVYASQALFSLTMSKNSNAGQGIQQTVQEHGKINVDQTVLESLHQGQQILVPMPDGRKLLGKVVRRMNASGLANNAATLSPQLTVISLANNAGAIELTTSAGQINTLLIQDVDNNKIYRASVDKNLQGQLILEDSNDYQCVSFPRPDFTNAGTAAAPVSALIPDLPRLKNLQSKPGAPHVLYINYWGGTLTDTAWNNNFNSGNPIEYDHYSNDSNPAVITEYERYLMWLGWQEAAEDYAAFNINVTTIQSVYDATPITDRTQIIATPTKSWYGSAGGVAYVGIFDYSTDYYKTGWAFNNTSGALGMTISHEAGHQLGLRHDGDSRQQYYRGHGNWGPIMGAPFGKPYVQWSKGEYPGANRQEDDINIIKGHVGLIVDDTGNALVNAANLDLPLLDQQHSIGVSDVDAFKFKLHSTTNVDIEVITELGKEDENTAANLAMDVSLYKITSDGSIISNIHSISSADVSPLRPLTNKFEYNASLAPGNYGLVITPSSPDTNWATGFGNYGNAGLYRISIDADVKVNLIGRPNINPATESGMYVWKDNFGNTLVKVIAGNNMQNGRNTRFKGIFVAKKWITRPIPIGLNQWDKVSKLPPNKIAFNLYTKRPWHDSFKFTANDNAALCLYLTDYAGGLFLGPSKVKVTPPFDIHFKKDCRVKTDGRPVINRSTDNGWFIWREGNHWHSELVAGNADGNIVYQGKISSSALLSEIKLNSFESNYGDQLIHSDREIDFNLKVSKPWYDGFEFKTSSDAKTCVYLIAPGNTRLFLGPNRVTMANGFDLQTQQSCRP